MYQPNPVDTSSVVLPEGLLALTEKLAEHIHDRWAEGRIAEGWIYGETRNDEKKTTPCLVPYDELPDGEKEYDRKTALEAIRFIVKMGYDVRKED